MSNKSEKAKKQREERRQQGLCIVCPERSVQKAVPGKSRCQSCLDRAAASTRNTTARRKQEGICAGPGCSEPVSGRTYCKACVQRQNDRQRKMQTSRKDAALCIGCGRRPPIEGSVRCKKCNKALRIQSKKFREDRIAQGLCKCGQPLVSNKKACLDCLEKGRGKQAAMKLKCMEAYGGPVCVGCGESEPVVLQVDHIDGKGNEHALSFGRGETRDEKIRNGRRRMYHWLIRNNFPPGYRVLCANCNIKAARGLPLPRELEAQTE